MKVQNIDKNTLHYQNMNNSYFCTSSTNINNKIFNSNKTRLKLQYKNGQNKGLFRIIIRLFLVCLNEISLLASLIGNFMKLYKIDSTERGIITDYITNKTLFLLFCVPVVHSIFFHQKFSSHSVLVDIVVIF